MAKFSNINKKVLFYLYIIKVSDITIYPNTNPVYDISKKGKHINFRTGIQ